MTYLIKYLTRNWLIKLGPSGNNLVQQNLWLGAIGFLGLKMFCELFQSNFLQDISPPPPHPKVSQIQQTNILRNQHLMHLYQLVLLPVFHLLHCMVTGIHFLVQRMLGNLYLVQNLQHIHLQFPNNKDDYIRYICFGNYGTNTLLLSISYFTVIN